MNIGMLILQIIGALAVLAVLVLIILGTWYAIEETREKRGRRIHAQATAVAYREIAQYVVATAHWFEDRKACEAIKAIGRCMGENGLIDANKAREEWRKACAEIDKGVAKP